MTSTPGVPRAIVLAGPNGAGKTTSAPLLLLGALGLGSYVNADLIAQGLSGFAPEAAAREAGRIMLKRLDALEARRESFAFETTLAGRVHLHRLERLRASGFHVLVFFLWLPSSDLAVARVEMRVRHGGHDVPEEDVRRRYRRGLRNFLDLYHPLASAWRVYDGSGRLDHPSGIPLVARGAGRTVLELRDPRLWQRIQTRMERLRERPDGRYAAVPDGAEKTWENDPADRAMALAFHAAVRLHRMHGLPLVVGSEEGVRYVDARAVSLPEDPL